MYRVFFLVLFFSGFMHATNAQQTIQSPAKDTAQKTIIAEVACGQCKFGLPGKSCDLAIRINGTAYFVDGTNIDSHGDAHAKDGFCNAIRKASVQGTIVNNRFNATYFKLLPNKTNKHKKQ